MKLRDWLLVILVSLLSVLWLHGCAAVERVKEYPEFHVKPCPRFAIERNAMRLPCTYRL